MICAVLHLLEPLFLRELLLTQKAEGMTPNRTLISLLCLVRIGGLSLYSGDFLLVKGKGNNISSLSWIRWLLSIGLVLIAAPAWGETLAIESSIPVFNSTVEQKTKAEAENRFPQLSTIQVSPDIPPLIRGVRGVVQDISQTPTTPQPQETPQPAAQQLDLSPEIIENSPVLQRWLRQVPNVLEDIRNDPSFRTRVRFGYSQFPSTGQAAGFNVGVEDIFIGHTGLTVSGDYHRSFNGKREAVGADVRYYVLPLGSYVNFAPQVGYRYVETGKFSTDGVNVGARLMLALSRTGAADISLTQSFVSPGSNEEVGITTLSFGYAVTRHWRLSTDIQKQNSREEKDSRVGIVVEWMP